MKHAILFAVMFVLLSVSVFAVPDVALDNRMRLYAFNESYSNAISTDIICYNARQFNLTSINLQFNDTASVRYTVFNRTDAVATSNIVNIGMSGNWTVSFKFRLDKAPNYALQPLTMVMNQLTGTSGWGMRFVDTPNRLQMWAYTDLGTMTELHIPAENLTIGQWVTLTFVKNGTEARSYVNASYQKNSTCGKVSEAGTNLSIGYKGAGTNCAACGGSGNFSIYDLVFFNRTLSVEEIAQLSGDTQPTPPVFTLLKIWNNTVLSNTQQNSLGINISALVNSSADFNCSLNVNGLVNKTTLSMAASNETGISFLLNFSSDEQAMFNYSLSCFVTGNWSDNVSTTTQSFWIDNVNPVIAWGTPSNDNKTLVVMSNNQIILPSINLSDFSLFSYNLTLFNQAGVPFYSKYNTSLNNATSIAVLENILMVSTHGVATINMRACDGHTANAISLSSKETLTGFDYDTVSIEPKAQLDVLTKNSVRQSDRYTFSFKTVIASDSKTYVVTAKDNIYDLNGVTGYPGHLVIGEKYWVDFSTTDLVSVKVNRVKNNQVEVVVTKRSPTSDWVFNSIGELNCINQTRTFFVVNYSQPPAPTVLTGEQIKLNLTLDYNASYIQDITANITYNGSSIAATRTYSGNSVFFNVTITTVYTNYEYNTSFNWTYVIKDKNGVETSYNLSNTQVSVKEMLLFNCNGTTNNKSITFWIRDITSNNLILSNITETATIYNNMNDSRTFTFAMQNVNNLSLCISPTTAIFPMRSTILFVQSTGYANKQFLDNFTLSSAEQNVTYYMVTGTVPITINLHDFKNLPLGNYIIKAYRVSSNGTQTLEDSKITDNAGIVILNLVQDYVTNYQFKFYDSNNNFIDGSTVMVLYSNVYYFNIGESLNVIDLYKREINCIFNLTYNFTDRSLSVNYTDLNGLALMYCLEIDYPSPNSTILQLNCSSASKGILTVRWGTKNATYPYAFYINVTSNSVDQVPIDNGEVYYNPVLRALGFMGAFFTLMFVGTIITAGVLMGAIPTLIALVFSMIILQVTQLFTWSTTTIAVTVILSAMLWFRRVP